MLQGWAECLEWYASLSGMLTWYCILTYGGMLILSSMLGSSFLSQDWVIGSDLVISCHCEVSWLLSVHRDDMYLH